MNKKLTIYIGIFVFLILVCIAGFTSYGKNKNIVSDSYNEEDHSCGPSREEELEQCMDASTVLSDTSCKYCPVKAVDENADTAWCVGDNPIGEFIGLKCNIITSNAFGIEILSGYAKNESLFRSNSRPKKILLEFEVIDRGLSGKELNHHLVYKKELLFKDKREYQKFYFDNKSVDQIVNDFNKNNNAKSYLWMVRLRIMEVYQGLKYNDTCISEIRPVDKDGKPLKILQNY